MLLLQHRFQQLQWRSGAAALGAGCLHDGGKDQGGILDGGKRDEAEYIREVAPHLGRDVERQARLAHTPGAGECEEAPFWAREQGTGRSDLPLPPNERGEWQREGGGTSGCATGGFSVFGRGPGGTCCRL